MRRRILNSILDLTGSQCSEANTGVMCSLFFVLVRTRAESLTTYCWSLIIKNYNNQNSEKNHRMKLREKND